MEKSTFLHLTKERQINPPLGQCRVLQFSLRIIKNEQAYPVYSALLNRVLEHIQLFVQSMDTQSHRSCHFLIILLYI